MRFYSNQYLNFALYQYEALDRESQALAVKPQAYEVVTRVRDSTTVGRLASARETSARRLLALHYKRHTHITTTTTNNNNNNSKNNNNNNNKRAVR